MGEWVGLIMPRHTVWMVLLSLSILPCGISTQAQTEQRPTIPGAQSGLPQAPGTAASPNEKVPEERLSGSISGTVVDQTGTAVVGARVGLTREDESQNQEVSSGDDGQFSFANIAPGPFRLTVTAEGFVTQTSSGVLHPGEALVVPPIVLAVTTSVTRVSVVVSRVEIAEEEIKEEEKQRVLGFIPNFYVTYDPNAVPLTTKQKFELAWKTSVDPVTIGIAAAFAGIEQADNVFCGYDRARKATESALAPAWPTRPRARSSAAPCCLRSSNRTRAISTKEPAANGRGFCMRWPTR